MKFEIIKELHQSISIAYAIKNFWQKFTLFYICLRLRRRNPIPHPLPFFWGGMRWRKIERIFYERLKQKASEREKPADAVPFPGIGLSEDIAQAGCDGSRSNEVKQRLRSSPMQAENRTELKAFLFEKLALKTKDS